MAAPVVLDPKPIADAPTPEEQAILDDDGKLHPKQWFQRKNWGTIAGILAVIIALVLFTVFQTPIVKALEPDAKWLHDTSGAWLIPFFLCMLLCIPPLFGIEIVLIIIGLTWGLAIGFVMAGLSVFLGELFTYYLFKYTIRERAAKLEEKDVQYAILACVIRDGGLKMAVVARYSIIPAHLLTALMATCGVSVWVFVVSAIVSLPRPFIVVFVGVNLKAVADGYESRAQAMIGNVGLAITILTTLMAAWYMYRKRFAVRIDVVRERCERRGAMRQVSLNTGMNSASSLDKFPSITTYGYV